MAYVTSWERIGEKRGKLEGKLEGKREVLLRLLSLKFTLGPEEQQKTTRADNAAKLNQALDRMIFASSKDDVLKELD
jgi:predicted transposase YdaD